MWPAPSTSLPHTTGPAHASLRAFSSNNHSYKWPIQWPKFLRRKPLKIRNHLWSLRPESMTLIGNLIVLWRRCHWPQRSADVGRLAVNQDYYQIRDKPCSVPIKHITSSSRLEPQEGGLDPILIIMTKSQKKLIFFPSWQIAKVPKLEIIFGGTKQQPNTDLKHFSKYCG